MVYPFRVWIGLPENDNPVFGPVRQIAPPKEKPGDTNASPDPNCSRRSLAGFALPSPQATPSFFCRLVEEVVYWKVNRFSG